MAHVLNGNSSVWKCPRDENDDVQEEEIAQQQHDERTWLIRNWQEVGVPIKLYVRGVTKQSFSPQRIHEKTEGLVCYAENLALKCFCCSTWVARSVERPTLDSAQVMIPGSWDQAPHWVLR